MNASETEVMNENLKDTYRRTVNATLEQISDLLKLNTLIRFISHFTRVLLSRGDATSGFTSSSVSQPSSSSSWFSSSVENSSSSKNDPPSPYSCVWTDTSLDSRCGEPSMKSANLSERQYCYKTTKSNRTRYILSVYSFLVLLSIIEFLQYSEAWIILKGLLIAKLWQCM